MVDDDWRDRAACQDWVDVFDATFDGSTRTSHPSQRQAAAVCAGCPVVDPCLRDALRTETPATAHGMRAGLMPAQRRRAATGHRASLSA